MKEYRTEQIRNVALIGNSGSGKTSLIDVMLYDAGSVDKLGSVDAGNSFLDSDPEEISRKTTLGLKLSIAEWKGCKLNIVDTPGYEDFYGDLASALRAVESAISVIDAVTGIGGGTEKSWMHATNAGVTKAIIINKLNAEQADFDATLESIKQEFDVRILPVHIPIGKGANFSGIVDIITMKAYEFDGKNAKEIEIPDDLAERAEELREELIEYAAEGEDELTEKYLEGEELTPEEIMRGLKAAVRDGIVVPVMCASSGANIGVPLILDFIVGVLPSPSDVSPVTAADGETTREVSPDAPLSALVIKTLFDPYVGKMSFIKVVSGTLAADSQVFNANRGKSEKIAKLYYVNGKNQIETSRVVAGDVCMSVKLDSVGTGDTLCAPDARIKLPEIDFPKPVLYTAIAAKNKGDEDKLGAALNMILEEDKTIKIERDQEMRQTVLSGLGDVQLNVICKKIKERFNVDTVMTDPRIPYRETIRKPAENVYYRHKKQTGGSGQFADVVLTIEPLERGGDFEFVDEIYGGAIPRNFLPAVEKGAREAMAEGILAGYPVVDVRVRAVDGKHHPVDSSDMAFRIASSMAFKAAMAKADPFLLEPIMNLEITVPDQYMGDVLGHLNSRRGRVLGMEQKGKYQTIKAQVPMAESFRYAIDLRSMTSARGWFTMEFSHYEEVPYDVAQKIIAEAQARKNEE